jgi:hypothetical protein
MMCLFSGDFEKTGQFNQGFKNDIPVKLIIYDNLHKLTKNLRKLALNVIKNDFLPNFLK